MLNVFQTWYETIADVYVRSEALVAFRHFHVTLQVKSALCARDAVEWGEWLRAVVDSLDAQRP